MMLDQPERVLDQLGAVLLMASPIRALMVRHQLEPRREVFRIPREPLFEPNHIGLLQVQDVAQGLRVPWAEHSGRECHPGRTRCLWRNELGLGGTRYGAGQQNQGSHDGRRRNDRETGSRQFIFAYQEC